MKRLDSIALWIALGLLVIAFGLGLNSTIVLVDDAAWVSPFGRLHTVQELPGVGIGLATAQRIVQRHGGRIWADGQVGEGAAMYFTLCPRVAGRTT